MKRSFLWAIALSLLFVGCRQQQKDTELIQRSFYNTVWERFDYVYNDFEIKETTSYDLTMQVSFTEDYHYNDFSMVFTVFDRDGNPYRAKGYKFNLKDEEDRWNVDEKDGCYTFTFPINKRLEITEPGKYRFNIEQKMPITPLVGVKELKLINNN
jgi:gliding motility-associated lipoprotein GldH